MKPSYSKSKSAGCGSCSGGGKRLVKGSPEAKAHMAKLRAMKGKRTKSGGNWFEDKIKQGLDTMGKKISADPVFGNPLITGYATKMLTDGINQFTRARKPEGSGRRGYGIPT